MDSPVRQYSHADDAKAALEKQEIGMRWHILISGYFKGKASEEGVFGSNSCDPFSTPESSGVNHEHNHAPGQSQGRATEGWAGNLTGRNRKLLLPLLVFSETLRSKLDLLVKQGERLRAFEVKWAPQRRIQNRAFQDAYKVNIDQAQSTDPLATNFLEET